MASGGICLAPRKIPSPLEQCPWLATVPAALGEIINPPEDRRARSHRFNRLECAANRCRLRFLTDQRRRFMTSAWREAGSYVDYELTTVLVQACHRGHKLITG